jgi:hypothetical protein
VKLGGAWIIEELKLGEVVDGELKLVGGWIIEELKLVCWVIEELELGTVREGWANEPPPQTQHASLALTPATAHR